MKTDNKIDSKGSGSSQFSLIIKILSKILLILLAFVPLLVDNNVIFPYISAKMIAIRICITLVFLLVSLNLIISKHYRQEFYSKVKRLVHNPIFITAGAFILSIGLSVLFAIDKYRAFWGNVERAEGFAGIVFYFAFFPLAYLIFSRKDWIWFFKATLLAGLILFIDQVLSIPSNARPGSFTGNPSFLAGFFLFVIMSALVVIYDSKKYRPVFRYAWQIASGLMALASILGIFFTQTRGTILGLGAGFVALAIYWAAKGKGIALYKKLNLRTAAIILISVLVIFSAFFIATQKDSFWQKIPGMDRFTNLTLGSSNDGSVQTRLISTEIGLNAINPANSGYVRFIFGWGQENFDVAYNNFYNPRYFEFEQQWFDRAHDKIMDALVMNGALGLLAYLSMWGSFVWMGFKKKGFSFDKMAALFFGVAFFVNLVTLFDQISTYIPLFAALGFMAFISDEEHHDSINSTPSKLWPYVLYAAVGIVLAFFVYVASVSLVVYSQLRGYVGLLETQNLQDIEDGLPGVLSPYTYGQQDIRGDFVSEISSQYSNNPELKPVLDQAIGFEDQVINLDPWDPRQSLIVAEAYDTEGRVTIQSSTSTDASVEALTYFKDAEGFYRAALKLAPERQDVLLPLAQNLVYQNRVPEALVLLKQCYDEDPKVTISDYEYGYVLALAGQQNYSQAVSLMNVGLQAYAGNLSQIGDTNQLTKMYEAFGSYFYSQKDAADFAVAMKGLDILQPGDSSDFDKAANNAQSGNWSGIQ
jgi:hypothetical protein